MPRRRLSAKANALILLKNNDNCPPCRGITLFTKVLHNKNLENHWVLKTDGPQLNVVIAEFDFSIMIFSFGIEDEKKSLPYF